MADTFSSDGRFPGYRFPAIIIGEFVWLRFGFNLSLRDIPALVATREISLSHETVREWCDTFGEAYAKEIRRRRPGPGPQVAPRRDVREDERCRALPVAGR